jgi:BRCA1-associated protein
METTSHIRTLSAKRRLARRTTHRPVTFGNPALGAYHGVVFTWEEADSPEEEASHSYNSPSHDHLRFSALSLPVIEGAEVVRHVAAVVDVPPEQIPEGVLNLARSHRSWIRHVRLLKADHVHNKSLDGSGHAAWSGYSDRDNIEGRRATGSFAADFEQANIDASSHAKDEHTKLPNTSIPTSIAEKAALIFAADEDRDQKFEGTLVSQDQDEVPDHRTISVHESTSPSSSDVVTYVVLFEMMSEETMRALINDLHGQPYTSLDETSVCNIFQVVALRGTGGVSLISPFLHHSSLILSASPKRVSHSNERADSNASFVGTDGSDKEISYPTSFRASYPNDKHNCAVCLEQMDIMSYHEGDDSDSNTIRNDHETVALFTTVCNHTFHVDCLLQGWQDSPCPVCRYDHASLNETLSQCSVCGTSENVYVCLICGVVSCDRDSAAADAMHMADTILSQAKEKVDTTGSMPLSCSNSHARQHFSTTLHAYALDTETQHVYDFAGGGYVHRLLQSKDDGKIVEVNDPLQTMSHARSAHPGLSDRQENEMVHRKLEGFATQYYTLLRSQLEQQRAYYEERLQEMRQEFSHTLLAAKPRDHAIDLILALKHQRQQLAQRLSATETRISKMREEVAFMRSMNESVEANTTALKQQVVIALQQRRETQLKFDECLPPLRDKVTNLMLQLESECR